MRSRCKKVAFDPSENALPRWSPSYQNATLTDRGPIPRKPLGVGTVEIPIIPSSHAFLFDGQRENGKRTQFRRSFFSHVSNTDALRFVDQFQ